MTDFNDIPEEETELSSEEEAGEYDGEEEDVNLAFSDDEEDEEDDSEEEAATNLLQASATTEGTSVTKDEYVRLRKLQEQQNLQEEQKKLMDENDDGTVAKSAPKSKKPFPSINNHAGMKQKLDEIEGEAGNQWIDTLTVRFPYDHTQVDSKDDIALDTAFYEQAKMGVELAQKAFQHFTNSNPIRDLRRPDDYFAEMLKTDRHMAKVRKRLVEHKRRIEIVEERKRGREMRKYGKQMQALKQQERAKQKRAQLEYIKEWRKEREANNTLDDDFDVRLEELEQAQKTDEKDATTNIKKKSKKRKAKDTKYGFGGGKRRKKSNTSSSFSDTSAFSVKSNRSFEQQNSMGKLKSRKGKRSKR